MKHILKLSAIATLILSCGNTDTQSVDAVIQSQNIEQIIAKKKAINAQQQTLKLQVKQLTEAVEKLQPSRTNYPLVSTLTVKTEPFVHFLELQGSVDTKQNLVLTPEMPGILNRVLVKQGQYVSKGQTLARIDDGGLAQQKAQLQIQANLAKTTFQRQERLWNQKIGSEIQYLNAKTNYDALEESVNQLNKQLAKTNIKAPFSGIIDDVITEQGNVVAAGQTPIIRIVNLSNMYIETNVPERYLPNVTKGRRVDVELPVLGKIITTKVKQVSNYINPANRTFTIEIAVPNTDKSIKPNLTARVKINDYNSENAILMPQNIISENAKGEQYVYVAIEKDNKTVAQQTIITTGKTQGDVIEVLSGLKANDKVINSGARSVKNGQPVEVIVE